METVELTPEITTTSIGLGCGSLMREPSTRRRRRLLDEAFDQGIRHFDVARMYGLGAAEGELGNFARGRRESIVIATKFGIEASSATGRLARLQSPARRLLARYPALRGYVKRRSDTLHQPHRYDAKTARTSLQTSLRELRTDYVDILFLHDPSPTDRVDIDEICTYMEDARQAGLVRAWGVAGEQDQCIHVKRSLPKATILQRREDIFSRVSPLPTELDPSITFGVLGNAIGRIARHLNASPERHSQWSETVGVDCSSSQNIAMLLMRDALEANPHGVVLFSTTRPERVHGLASTASAVRTEDDPPLAGFRRKVRDELLSIS